MAKYQKKLEEDIRCPLEYGLTRVLDDTEMLAQVHYVLVNPDYQGMGIAGKMIEYIKE
uniref:GNAT family N-acetyltransferase n=1 Tax=Anaerostipes sp. TaxID=1872530 RepID=UPI003FEFE71A